MQQPLNRTKQKMTPAMIRQNRQILQRIMKGNKKNVGAGVKKDTERAEVIMKDAMNWVNDRAYNNLDKANKEMQKVLDYYK